MFPGYRDTTLFSGIIPEIPGWLASMPLYTYPYAYPYVLHLHIWRDCSMSIWFLYEFPILNSESQLYQIHGLQGLYLQHVKKWTVCSVMYALITIYSYPSLWHTAHCSMWGDANQIFNSIIVLVHTEYVCALSSKFVGRSRKISKQSIITTHLGQCFIKSTGIFFSRVSLSGHKTPMWENVLLIVELCSPKE